MGRKYIYHGIRAFSEERRLSISSDLIALDWPLIIAVAGMYILLVMGISRSEFMKSHGVTTWGPVIFIRTMRGISLLDRLGRYKRFWRFIASAGVPLVMLSMAYFLVLLLLMGYLIARSPPEPGSYNAPRNILLIPGLNEYIPVVWGWIALLVTMVVHEFSHGILSRVEGVKVKSMGLVFLAAPIAAFVEPDDEELFGTKDKKPVASRWARVRILSAGVTANFAVAIVAMVLFFGPVLGAISPIDRLVVADVQNGSFGEDAGFAKNMIVQDVNGLEPGNLSQFYNLLHGQTTLTMKTDDHVRDIALKGEVSRGVMVTAIYDDSPASKAGVPARSVITRLNDTAIAGVSDFRSYMNSTYGGEELMITTPQGVYRATLESRSGKGFIGIGISGDAVYTDGVIIQDFPAKSFLSVLRSIPSSGMAGFATLLALPFTGIPGFTEKGFPGFSGWISNFFEPSGWAEPLGTRFFWIANLLLWVGWINMYAGLFNSLPAVPLDGGHIFRDLVQAGFERVVSIKEAEKLTRTVVALLAWLVLTSLIITVVAPYLAHGLPG